MTDYVALIRGINVGATRKLPMAELRAALEAAGHGAVRTYVQSGNILLSSDLPQIALEDAIEALITARFGLQVPVIVRPANVWGSFLAVNPMRDAGDARPNLVHLGVAKRPPVPGAVAALNVRARPCERILAAGDAIWFDFGDGAGASRLSPSLIDRLVGSPVTLRNWRTV